jgi:histidinol-phosphate aminotransferase
MITAQHGEPDALGVPRWDFSTNANACGPCPGALAAVQQADARHYPDPAYTALRETLAALHAVDAVRIVLAGSASEFIGRFTAWVAREGGQRAWLPALAYGDYTRAAQVWKFEQVLDPAHAPLAWLCEPSSPLGQAEEVAQDAVASGAQVVLDRAYEPLRLSGRCSLEPAALQQVWQLWTPNKAMGSWSTSAQRQSHRASPRHAGHRCGTVATRRWAMVSSLRQIGMKRPKWRRTLRSISASVGEGGGSGFVRRCGVVLR